MTPTIALVAALVSIAVGVVALFMTAVKLGRQAGRMEQMQAEMLSYLPDLKELRAIHVRLGTLEGLASTTRSDIKGLAQRIETNASAIATMRGEMNGAYRERAISLHGDDE